MKTSKHLLRYLFFLLSVVLAACSGDDTGIGGIFLDNTIRTVIIDTCSINLSTVSIDSVVTSGKNSVMAGSYSDTVFGRTECTGYIPFTVPGSYDFPEAEIVFDSVNLVMVLNGTWFGDTTSVQTYQVHLLDEVIELPDDEEYYSTWSVPYSAVPVAAVSFKPHPAISDTVSVRLPDMMGEDLLDKMMNEDESVLGSQERFMNYFKGIALTAGDGNDVVLGVAVGDTSMVINLYYHYSTLTRTEETITIVPLTERTFYSVNTDRSGTRFSDLRGKTLSSDLTGNTVLVQALTGAYVRIDFPYLNNLLQLGDYCTITEASLLIYPVRGTYSKYVPLPGDLSLYVSNENDVTLGYITTYSGDALQTGNLVKDDLFNVDTYYSYDITSFLQDQLGAFGINSRSLQLIVPQASQAVSLNTLVAGDGSYTGNRMKIKVTYLIYDIK
jgi:hypothetical protein